MAAGNSRDIQIILLAERYTMPEFSVNRYLDAALLKPELPETDVVKGIEQCVAYEVKSVCVRPCDIELALQMCRGTTTEVDCVLNFPHGVGLSAVKAFEAEQGHVQAQQVVAEAVAYLGMGIVNLIHLFGPEKVIISGGMSNAETLILEPVQAFVRERIYGNLAELVEIIKAKLGEYAPMIGAAFFCRDDRYRYEG